MADSLRQEVKHLNIDVVKIQPGVVNTNFGKVAFAKFDNSHIPEDYQSLAEDFRLFTYTLLTEAESPNNTANYIVEAAETENPQTTYVTNENSRQGLEFHRSLSEREYDDAMLGQI